MLPLRKINKVGGEIDAFCSRCGMELAHTILAMVDLRIARVRCNTCQAQHSLRKNPRGGPSPSSSSASPPRKTASPSMASSVPLLLASADASKARNYSPRENFAEGDFLNHPSFGLGLVQAVRGDKMDVAFKAFEKTLIHGKIPPG